MNRKNFLPVAMLLGLVCVPAITWAQYPGQNEDLMKVKVMVPLKAEAFDYSDVRLLDGPYKQAMEIDQKWLKTADVDRFLHSFYVTAGLRTDARAFGGWESLDTELRGHSTGHMMSALALMYAQTGDVQYKEKGEKFVAGLAECQSALGASGYLSAFPENLINRAIEGKTVWAPWYTLHKIYQGLIDQYVLCGNQQAFEVVDKMCDWAYNKLHSLDNKQLQRMLSCEFGGMPETFYNMYALSGKERDKELAEMFYHEYILNPLANGEDKLGGNHANTQIPKAVAEARGYELTAAKKEHDIAEFFWNTVLKNHTYVTGGNSDSEYFGPAGKLSDRLGQNTTETCNTYNMLKLTRHLFTWDADPKMADYYERALYNHILSSQDPVSGGVTYYHTLRPGSMKDFNMPFRDHTCCVGTGYENHAKYGEAIYYRGEGDKSLFVNLFIASELTWKEKGLKIKQETKFPDESSTTLTVNVDKPLTMPIYVRYPGWATKGVTVTVNGKKFKVKTKPQSYIEINRTWNSGDKIEMTMPMSLSLEAMPDNPRRAALLYGPIVLAAQLGDKELDEEFGVPVLVDASMKNLEKWIKPVEGKSLTFKTEGVGRPKDCELAPLFRTNHERYTVYFDFFTEADWTNKQVEYEKEQKEQKAIDARTIDIIGVGESQSERDHHVDSRNSYIYNQGGKMGRDLRQEGFIKYRISVKPGMQNQLMLSVYGTDKGSYLIKLDGKEFSKVQLEGTRPMKLSNFFFDIPEEFIGNKTVVEIEFLPNGRTPQLYGLRTLTK